MFRLAFSPSGQEKKCSKCGAVKYKKDFPFCSKSSDSVLSYCRACKTAHNTPYKRLRRLIMGSEYHAECLAEEAIRDGRLKRKPCEVCSCKHKVEAHHDSYAVGKELEVIFLCHSCHRMRHKHLNLFRMNRSLFLW